jgi:hypothetical protein
MSSRTRKYLSFTSSSMPTDDEPAVVDVDQRHGGHQLVSQWRSAGGRAEPTSITITRVDSSPLTATTIRQLPLGDMIEEARREVAAHADLVEVLAPGSYGSLSARGPQRGRSHTPEVLAEVAQVYRRAYYEGQSVQQAVAEHFTISPDAATKRIMKARAAGLLDGIGRPAK